MQNSPTPKSRALNIAVYGWNKYITIEPIMDFDLKEMIELIKICNPAQVNIGADSGNNKLPEPSAGKILELIEALKEFTVIDQKKNLSRIINNK